MRTPTSTNDRPAARHNLIWQILTFDRLMTGPIVHLIYWAGLGLIALSGFTVMGAAAGVAVRGGSLLDSLLAIPVVVAGALVLLCLVLLWRGACEFYLAVFRVAEDLRALRLSVEREREGFQASAQSQATAGQTGPTTVQTAASGGSAASVLAAARAAITESRPKF